MEVPSRRDSMASLLDMEATFCGVCFIACEVIRATARCSLHMGDDVPGPSRLSLAFEVGTPLALRLEAQGQSWMHSQEICYGHNGQSWGIQ